MQFHADTIGTDHLVAGMISEDAWRIARCATWIEENVIFGALQQGGANRLPVLSCALGGYQKRSNMPLEEVEKGSWWEQKHSAGDEPRCCLRGWTF